ncbi:MAG: outer membrane beta-barrel family protein [Gelidibacter sp.]
MKRPTIFLLIFCVLLSPALCLGQDLSISGFIDDAQDQPVAYANVLLMKSQDSTIVKGVSSDENGFFLLDKLSQENYLVKVSFLGFNDIYKSVELTENIDLGTIVLEENSQLLNEINIIAKRPTLKKEADRLVFNIENTALVEGNMFQVLKNTPGILVLDNSISVKNSTPTVYINDKKVHLTSDELVQLLEGTSANSIKSVEVITNPSAKYDAESGAVINIVMSKNLVTGYRGNVFANYTQGVFPRYEAGTSHFFKNEKVDFFANYTYSDKKTNRDDDRMVNFLDANQAIDRIYRSSENRNTWSKTHNFNFNFDYSIDEENTLSLSSTMLVMPYFEYKIQNRTNVFEANENLDFYFQTNNASDDDKKNLGFDLDYVHKFKKAGEKFSINGHFTTFDYSRNQKVMSNYFDDDGTFLLNSAFRTDNNQDTKIYTAQADYLLPIGDSSTFETGLKTSNIKNNSDITQFDIVNGEETLDANNTDAFDYDESIVAGYVNYSKDWEKLSLIAGLRAEQTNVKGLSVFDNVANKQDYLEWFPSASLSYAFSDNFTLYGNYKRSIQRPDYQSLNPFQFFLNDVTIVTGNPNLQPVIVDHSVIGTSFYKYFTVEAYHKIYNDNIFELPRQDNTNNTLTYTPLNINKTTEFGFDFIVYFNMTKRWAVYCATSFYNTKDEGVFNNVTTDQSQWANFTNLNNDFTFLKDNSLSANLNLIYFSKNLQGFVESKALFISELNVSKSIWNKKGTISLAVSDLFNAQIYRTSINYLNQNSSSRIDTDIRSIKFGFRYKFGNTRLQTNQRTKEQQETDRLEKKGN